MFSITVDALPFEPFIVCHLFYFVRDGYWGGTFVLVTIIDPRTGK